MIKSILNDLHFKQLDYKQRVTTKEWKNILLNNQDKIIYKGTVVNLIGKNIGAGVYEIFKNIKQYQNNY